MITSREDRSLVSLENDNSLAAVVLPGRIVGLRFEEDMVGVEARRFMTCMRDFNDLVVLLDEVVAFEVGGRHSCANMGEVGVTPEVELLADDAGVPVERKGVASAGLVNRSHEEENLWDSLSVLRIS